MGWEGQTRFVSVAVTRCTRERTDRLREEEEEEGRNNDRERDRGGKDRGDDSGEAKG